MVLATFMVQPKCRVHSLPRYRDTVNDPIDALSQANATCLLPPPPPLSGANVCLSQRRRESRLKSFAAAHNYLTIIPATRRVEPSWL